MNESPSSRPAPFAAPRWRPVFDLAERQGGVLSRKQLYALGVTRWEVRAHLRAARWKVVTDQAIALHNGEVAVAGHFWAAVIHAGPQAVLDGEASLVASGLLRYQIDRIRVSVPKGYRARRRRRFYDIRETRRLVPDDRVASGVPRTRVPVAAIRGALWAKSDRQAALLLSMAIEQGMTTAAHLGEELLRIKKDKRRLFLHAIVNDLLDGVRALGELDMARELRKRGLPPPTHQVIRKGKRGRYYLDLYWPDLGVVVELDGIQHTWAENVVNDALRHNDIALARDVVLRVPLLGLRLQPNDFYAQIGQALNEAAARKAA